MHICISCAETSILSPYPVCPETAAGSTMCRDNTIVKQNSSFTYRYFAYNQLGLI